ncbi:hypothetical protein [Nereida ignava]|uniref:hypothetical protein n=1 Tax=Nereida ignava TaxID=282199 RepID=UPI0030F82BBF
MSSNKKTRVDTGITELLPHSSSQRVGYSTRSDNDYSANFDNSVKSLFGNNVSITRQMGIADLDLRESASHTTTGIPYAIHGSATLVQQKVAHALASYQDPIKAIFGTAVHKDREIIIRRKYVVGGQAMITPERAPARTVAIKEDERRVVLARYGGDLEMNLNLFLRPEDAAEEFNMKLDAQKNMLEQQLCTLGYNKIMGEGTQLQDAMMRASPLNTHLQPHERQARAEKLYVHTLFGTMNKNMYPLESLMASAKAANLYTPGAPHGYTTCIVPSGMFEMHKYTKPENLVYNLNGVKATDRAPIKLALEGGHKDPRTGMTILVHTGRPNTEQRGTPYAVNGGGGLTRERKIGVYYRIPNGNGEYRYPNCANGSWVTVPGTENAQVVAVQYTVHASSAIMAVPGSDTGELLYAYPSTGISTSQTTESMKMQLRVYLGAVLYDPAKVLILPDVFVEGITKMDVVTTTAAAEQSQEELLKNDCPVYSNRLLNETKGKLDECRNKGFTFDAASTTVVDTLYCGRVQKKEGGKWVDICENRGHLGKMDDPDIMNQLGGYAFDRNQHTAP